MERVVSAAFTLGLLLLFTVAAGVLAFVLQAMGVRYPRMKEAALAATIVCGLATLVFCAVGVFITAQILGTLG